MSNIFHEAIEPKADGPKTIDRSDYPPFFRERAKQAEYQRQAAMMSRQDMFLHGVIGVEDLDDEELRLGRCRDAHGRIMRPSNKTEMVPRDLYEAMVAEHAKRFDEKLRQELDDALDTMAEIMKDPTVEPKDRADAAKWFVDRVRGKAVDRVAVTVQKQPWEELLGDVAHVTRAQHEAMKRGEIIDAEVVGADESAPQAHHEGMATSGGQETQQQADLEPDSMGHVGTNYVEAQPFTPADPTPTHDNPHHAKADHKEPLSAQIAEAQAEAARVAEARKDRRKTFQNAKSRRIAARLSGADVLQRKLSGTDFGKAQERMESAASGEDS